MQYSDDHILVCMMQLTIMFRGGVFRVALFLLIGLVHTALGQRCSCDGSGGCDFSQQCGGRADDGSCTKANVVLGMSANISSLLDSRIWNSPSGPACKAVDGRTSNQYIPINQNNPSSANCFHTNIDDNFPWWEVQLDRNYTISNISIFRRDDNTNRMDSVKVIVNDQLCYTFSTVSQLRTNIRCDPPLRGSYIRLEKTSNDRSTHGYYLIVCEVQVWVCTNNRFGDNCDKICHCANNAECDNYYGTCPADCASGFHGENCDQPCPSNCIECTKEGVCQMCQRGFYLDGTNGCVPCSAHCKQSYTCDSFNGTCTECVHGYFGNRCEKSCGTNCVRCHQEAGTCTLCSVNFIGPLCNVCADGHFGDHCEIYCDSNCLHCDQRTGNCLVCARNYIDPNCTVCAHGHYGEHCDKPCPSNCLRCEQQSGNCTLCTGNLLSPECTVLAANNVSDSVHATTIAGTVVGSILLIGIVVIIFGVLLRSFIRRYFSFFH